MTYKRVTFIDANSSRQRQGYQIFDDQIWVVTQLGVAADGAKLLIIYEKNEDGEYEAYVSGMEQLPVKSGGERATSTNIFGPILDGAFEHIWVNMKCDFRNFNPTLHLYADKVAERVADFIKEQEIFIDENDIVDALSISKGRYSGNVYSIMVAVMCALKTQLGME